jgi:hypothetical protein
MEIRFLPLLAAAGFLAAGGSSHASLLAHYTFDNESNRGEDSSGNGNDPYTGNPGFAAGDGVITPGITTGTMLGSPQAGQITNVRPGARTDGDFLNSAVSFTSDASGNATVLLTSTTKSPPKYYEC